MDVQLRGVIIDDRDRAGIVKRAVRVQLGDVTVFRVHAVEYDIQQLVEFNDDVIIDVDRNRL